MKTILFQGDSITDASRNKALPHALGTGYAHLITAELKGSHPGEYECYNRGVSGNRSTDVYARIKDDIINLKPDVMSILMGINDVWHEINHQNGVSPDKYFKIYCMLIEEVKEALPDIKIMILEPFVLEGTDTKDIIDRFREGRAEMAKRARMVAEKYGLVFVPLQEVFDKALEKAPSDYWLADGVHPTVAGHYLIKNEWLRGYEKLK